MATEKRLIDVTDDNIKEILEKVPYYPDEIWKFTAMTNRFPAVDAVEVVHGRWIGYHEADIGYDEYGVRCSNCNFEVEDHKVDFIMNYCPNCGAKMDGGKDDA